MNYFIVTEADRTKSISINHMLRACSEVNLHKGSVTSRNIEGDCYLYLLMVDSVASQFGGLADSLDSDRCIRFA